MIQRLLETAILELVLDKQKEQYTLILNSLKIEIEKIYGLMKQNR